MNAKTFSLALATLALLSTGAVYAEGISANVGPIQVGAGTTLIGQPILLNNGAVIGGSSLLLNNGAVIGGSNILEYPAVAANSACNPCARAGLLGGLFHRRGPWFDLDAFGLGVKLGGPGPDFYGPSLLGANAMIYPSTNLAYSGLTSCGVNTFASVIPTTLGGTGLSGEKIGNPWLDLHLWRFGFSAGTVNPNYDMRNAGAW